MKFFNHNNEFKAREKETIDRIAEMNNVSISYVTRMLIADSIKHISERNIFKMVVE
jgi:hypothetical protein